MSALSLLSGMIADGVHDAHHEDTDLFTRDTTFEISAAMVALSVWNKSEKKTDDKIADAADFAAMCLQVNDVGNYQFGLDEATLRAAFDLFSNPKLTVFAWVGGCTRAQFVRFAMGLYYSPPSPNLPMRHADGCGASPGTVLRKTCILVPKLIEAPLSDIVKAATRDGALPQTYDHCVFLGLSCRAQVLKHMQDKKMPFAVWLSPGQRVIQKLADGKQVVVIASMTLHVSFMPCPRSPDEHISLIGVGHELSGKDASSLQLNQAFMTAGVLSFPNSTSTVRHAYTDEAVPCYIEHFITRAIDVSSLLLRSKSKDPIAISARLAATVKPRYKVPKGADKAAAELVYFGGRTLSQVVVQDNIIRVLLRRLPALADASRTYGFLVSNGRAEEAAALRQHHADDMAKLTADMQAVFQEPVPRLGQTEARRNIDCKSLQVRWDDVVRLATAPSLAEFVINKNFSHVVALDGYTLAAVHAQLAELGFSSRNVVIMNGEWKSDSDVATAAARSQAAGLPALLIAVTAPTSITTKVSVERKTVVAAPVSISVKMDTSTDSSVVATEVSVECKTGMSAKTERAMDTSGDDAVKPPIGTRNCREIVIMVDNSGSMASVMSVVYQELNALVRELKAMPRTKVTNFVTIYFFAGEASKVRYRCSLDELREFAVGEYRADGKTTAIYNTMHTVLDDFDKCKNGRFYMLTDGADVCKDARGTIAVRVVNKIQRDAATIKLYSTDDQGIATGQKMGISAVQLDKGSVQQNMNDAFKAMAADINAIRATSAAVLQLPTPEERSPDASPLDEELVRIYTKPRMRVVGAAAVAAFKAEYDFF